MAFLTATPSKASIYQLESTDEVQGGAGGIANSQAQSLLDRMEWMRIGGIYSALTSGFSTTLTAAGLNKHYKAATGSGGGTLIIPSFSSWTDGDFLIIENEYVPTGTPSLNQGYVQVSCQAPDNLIYGHLTNLSEFYVGPNDVVVLKKESGKASVQIVSVQYAGGVEPGTVVLKPTGNMIPGFLYCNGGAVSRTQYVRLFNTIGTTYGAGNGTTTFNLPSIGNVSAGNSQFYFYHVKI